MAGARASCARGGVAVFGSFFTGCCGDGFAFSLDAALLTKSSRVSAGPSHPRPARVQAEPREKIWRAVGRNVGTLT